MILSESAIQSFLTALLAQNTGKLLQQFIPGLKTEFLVEAAHSVNVIIDNACPILQTVAFNGISCLVDKIFTVV